MPSSEWLVQQISIKTYEKSIYQEDNSLSMSPAARSSNSKHILMRMHMIHAKPNNRSTLI